MKMHESKRFFVIGKDEVSGSNPLSSLIVKTLVPQRKTRVFIFAFKTSCKVGFSQKLTQKLTPKQKITL